MATREIVVNMVPGGVTPVIHVSQYDDGYGITANLIENSGTYTVPTGATVSIEGTKPDGHGYAYLCTYQDNAVVIPVNTQMTAVKGKHPCELVVRKDGLRVGSKNMIMAVEVAGLGEDTIISDTELPAIIALAQEQEEAAASSASQAAASAIQAASSAASAETAKTAAMDAAEDAIDAAQELQTAIQFNAALIHETASGAVASFADGADNIPMQSLVTEITPAQSGSGDPSPTNVRPISGRTGLTVTRCGRNLGKITLNSIANADIGEGSYTASGLTFSFTKVSDNGVSEIVVNGTPTARVTSMLNRNLLVDIPPGRYILSGCPSGGASNKYRLTCWDNTTSTTLASDFGSGATFELVGGHNVFFAIDFSQAMAGQTISNLVFKPMIRPASDSNDAYEPYNGTSFPITWESIAGTVYGGTLDVVSGVLTVDMAVYTFAPDRMILTGPLSGYTRKYVYRNGTVGGFMPPIGSDEVTKTVCNILPAISRTQGATENYIGVFQYNSGSTNEIRFSFDRESAYDSASKIYDLGLTVAIPLKEPTTYQLTPTEVRTLLGGNTIYTDAGDVSVEYIADTKLYIDNKIAELQALVLEN